jgi:sulfatase modifying factor 1
MSKWLYPLFRIALVFSAIACTRAAGPEGGPEGTPLAASVPAVGSAMTMHASVESSSDSSLLAKASPKPAASAPDVSACPAGMVLVEGSYCPDVEQTCLEWMDPPGSRYEHFRCARYAKPVCHGKRVKKRFCIDETERREPDGELPMNGKSWTAATKVCKGAGARLCMTSEWQFACEGEEMRPYPYGFERDSTACNVDVMSGLGHVGRLVDHRARPSDHPRCVSPFGVHDMAGNVDEWTTVDGKPRGVREVMKGSWWLPGRHACRQFQGGHGAHYGGTETGVRCCSDALTSSR